MIRHNKKCRLTNVLHPYWDSKAVGLNLAKYYPVFSWVKQTERKLDWIKDSEGDRMLMYQLDNYNTKEYLILE